MGKLGGETNIPYVIKKGARYHYKRRYPTDLRAKNPDLPVFMERSLGTADHRVAVHNASTLNLEFDAIVRRLSASPFGQVDTAVAKTFVASTIKILGTETAGPEFPMEGDSMDGWQLIPDPSGNPFLAQAVHRDNKAITPTPERSLERITEFLNAELRRLTAVQDDATKYDTKARGRAGRITDTIKEVQSLLEPLKIDLSETVKIPPSINVPTLSDIAVKWAESDLSRPEQHLDQYRYACRLFEDLHGKRDIRQIKTLEISQFVEQLRLMPASTRAEIRSANMVRAIELGKQLNLPTLSASTVNKHLSAVKTILNFAFQGGYIDENPGDRLRVKRNKKTKKARDFTREEIGKLVTAICSEHKSSDDDFWIPIVSLYQGARREEVCQIEKADIQHIDGIPTLNIRILSEEDDADSVKSLKNENSRRLTPIHPDLIRAGFLEFVASSPGPRVFASLKQDSRGDFGGTYGKRFARMLKNKAGIDAPRIKVFHSLRHTFITACRNALMPETMEQTLSGHLSQHIVHDGYGSRQELPLRLEWISKVDFKVPVLTNLIESLSRR